MNDHDVILTREISPLPFRAEDAHKGDAGRVIVLGGSCSETVMVGAPALAANAALRGGAGLVRMLLPEPIRAHATVLAPCATARTLPSEADAILRTIDDFDADVVALGPGLGDTLSPGVVAEVIASSTIPLVVDADGLNRLAEAAPQRLADDPARIVLTPHPGEMRRLLRAAGCDRPVERTPESRRDAACALVEAWGCVVVLKGRGTVVTNGQRLYINQTGNAGLATGGTGDVLTGLIAALIGQGMEPFEAAILGVYLHGLAGDFAAEELGRYAMTAMDLLEYLPEAFGEHELAAAE